MSGIPDLGINGWIARDPLDNMAILLRETMEFVSLVKASVTLVKENPASDVKLEYPIVVPSIETVGKVMESLDREANDLSGLLQTGVEYLRHALPPPDSSGESR